MAKNDWRWLSKEKKERQNRMYGMNAEDAHQRQASYHQYHCGPCDRFLDASETDKCKKCGRTVHAWAPHK